MDTLLLQQTIAALGYDVGQLDGVFGDRTRAAVEAFQSDSGLSIDGICGPLTSAALQALSAKVGPRLTEGLVCRRLRMTNYYLIDEKDYPVVGGVQVPVYVLEGGAMVIPRWVSPAFFAHAALEGTARCADGTLINVQGSTVPVSATAYQPVLDYAKRDGFSHVEYAGIRLNAAGQVDAAVVFENIPASDVGKGYGMEHGYPKVPWYSCAADPRYFSFGEIIYVPELAGMALPDGSAHTGNLLVNDTGSAIQGLHVDWFVGDEPRFHPSNPQQPEYPRLCHVVAALAGIPASNTFGLVPS